MRCDWKLFLAVSIYASVFSIATILKHYAFLSTYFDLGIYNQAFWTTLFEHKLFYEAGDVAFNPNGSFFGSHFSPILFILLPFYAIYPSVEILLVMQTVILALGAFPVYWMASGKLGKKAGRIISIIYLAYPPLIFMNLNDFHLEAFTSTFFLFTVYYLEQEEWPKYFVFMILAMSTIEFAPLISVFIALYGFILYSKGRFKNPRRTLMLMILTLLIAIIWFICALMIKALINPYTRYIPSHHYYLISKPDAIIGIILESWESKIFYIIGFLGPLAFLPILAPEPLIMALPWIGFSFVSEQPLHYYIYQHYNGFVIPFVFVALIQAIRRLHNNGIYVRKLYAVMLVSALVFGLHLSGAPNKPSMYQLPVQNEHVELLNSVIALIPQNASILTQNDVLPHVSNRLNACAYIPSSLIDKISIDYILVDVNSQWFRWKPNYRSVEGDLISPGEFALRALIDGEYGVLASAMGVLLLKKGYADAPAIFIPVFSEHNYSDLVVAEGTVIEDGSSASSKILYHSVKNGTGTFWYGPYVNLPPGEYRVVFTLKVDETIELDDHVLTLDVTASSGNVLLAMKHLYGVDTIRGKWFNATLSFGITSLVEGVEFRGHVMGNCSVYLDRIILEQL